MKEIIKQGSRLITKKAKQWMKEAAKESIPKKLFGEFWFEGELCILFADTNVGKSILAVQIADAITKDKPIPEFESDALRQKVLYFDFELSKKQFENRYSKNYQKHYVFNPRFFRVEKNDICITIGNDYSNESLEPDMLRMIIESKSKIIIIDNLTGLENNIEKAAIALPLMKRLNALKKQHQLSILILAHTPKRNLSKPITLNDLGGSKTLMNYCDSAFTIGESAKDKNIRYLKQIKVRATEKKYDTENVAVCQVSKAKNYLQFEFLKHTSEQEHLKKLKDIDQVQLIYDAKALHEEGKSYREIANKLGVSHMKVSRIIKGSLCNR